MILRRGGKNTQKNYTKKILMIQIAMMLLNCCTEYASKFGNSAAATGLEKVKFHFNHKEKQAK